MKKIVFTFIILLSFFCQAVTGPKEKVILNEETIKLTANQLDFLHDYNENKQNGKKWYVVILGKDIQELKNYLEGEYEHLDVSNSSWEFEKDILDKINNSLIAINEHKDFASYAIITDAQQQIIIPTTPISKMKMGSFLDELENKLITAGNENVLLQSEQRADFKKIEAKVRASSNRQSKWIQNSIDEVLNRATKFKNSSKKYKILHYSVITLLNFANQGEDDISTVEVQAHGTRFNFPQNDKPDLDLNVIKAFRNTYYNSISQYKEYEKLMLARVASYQQYLEGKDVDIEGLKEGFGKKVFIAQQEKVESENEQKNLITLCDFLSEQFAKQTISDKYEAIVDIDATQMNKDRVSLLESIIKNNITTKEALLDLYPYYGVAREYNNAYNAFRVYFSKYHLWTKTGDLASHDVIPDDYNLKSYDYVVSTDRNIAHPYFYSLDDLIARYKYIAIGNTSNILSQEILKLEYAKMAHSVCESEFNAQYNARFKTNDAYPFIAYTAALWAEDVLATYMTYRLVFQYGAFLMEEIAKQIGNELFRDLIKKHGKDALQGAIIDYGVQVAFNYMLNEDITTFKEAASSSNINWTSVAWSATENTIKYKGMLMELGISGAGACLVNGLSEADGFKDEFDYESCVIGLGITYGIKALFKVGSSPYLRKQAIDALKKGKDKLRNLLIKKGVPEDKADEFVESVQKSMDEGDNPNGSIGNTFDLNIFKNLKPRIPSGSKLTNIKKSEFINFGYKIKPTNGKLKSSIDDIVDNGDKLGQKTEDIVDDIMENNNYNKLDGKYGSNNGYDGIYIKGDVKNPTEIIILESKQFKYNNGAAADIIEHGGVTLNPPSGTTPLPTQMSDGWIDYVALKLNDAGKTNIGNMILLNKNKIVKYVSAVDKTQGEINFLKLGNYN